MATPFTATAVLRLGSPTSINTKTISLYSSDVAGEYYKYNGANGPTSMNFSNQAVYLTELILDTS